MAQNNTNNQPKLRRVRGTGIYEGDEFEYMIDTRTGNKVVTKHTQKLGNIDNAKIVGAWCLIPYENDPERQPYVEVMTRDEILTAWQQGPTAGKSPAHLKFTVGSTGKISGNVNYKGKAYSFTAKCSYCYMGIMRFSPSVKVGKTTFKPGTVTVENDLPDGRERPFASCDSERFLAYKSCNFVKAGERGATYVGQSIPLSAEHDVSGLSPGKVSLNVLLGTGDRVIVSGKVNGKKVSLSTQMSLKKATTDNNTLETTYEMYADIIFPGGKYYRTLKLKFILFPDGNVGLLEPELLSIDAMWE